MEFVQSEHDKRKLIYDGYIYVKQKELENSVISYECEKCQHSNCKTKIKICENEVVCHVNDHSHATFIFHSAVLFVWQEIKLLTSKGLHSKSLPKQFSSHQKMTQLNYQDMFHVK